MTATDHALELVHAAARAASDKLGQHIIAFDVSEQLVITDAFLLSSATNDRQVKSIVDEIEDKLREIGAKPIRREGERDGRWVLIDYAEIVVHVQHEEEREFYALERLWRDCPIIALPADVTSGVRLTGPSADSSCSGTAGPPGTPSGGPRATPTSSSTTSATRRRRRWRRTRRARPRSLLWTSDLARARRDGGVRRKEAGLEPAIDAAAARVRPR